MSSLLINEHPLMVLPGLATKIGLNEAIILQQIHYWTRDQRHVIDGHSWTYNTVEEWRKQFPFWSNATIRRSVDSLIEKGLLLKRKLSENRFDATLWYAIDVEVLASMSEQIDLLKMSKWECSKRANGSAQNEQITSTETSTKTTTETTSMSGRPDDAREVLDFLNASTRSSYRAVASNLDKIAARLKEGATVEEMKQVIARKSSEWLGTTMEKYLRPETLFNATKYNQYVGQIGKPIIRQDAADKQERARAFMDVLTGRSDSYDANDPFTIDAPATRIN